MVRQVRQRWTKVFTEQARKKVALVVVGDIESMLKPREVEVLARKGLEL